MADDNQQESTNESGSNSKSFNGFSPFKQDSDRGNFSRGRGGFNIGRGNFDRGRGSFNRGRGSFNRGRGNFNRGRGNFNRGRGNFNGDRGSFNGGRGNFNRGRGYDRRYPRSPRGHFDFRNRNSSFEDHSRDNEFDESFAKRRKTDFAAPVSEKLSELIAYYKHISTALQDGVKEDEKAIFVMNALEVSTGEEVSLCSDGFSGRCIESLLNHCKDNAIWMRFMTAFASERQQVISNPSSSHIAELLISYAMRSLQNWEEILESDEDSKESEFTSFCLNWLSEFGDFVLENLNDIAKNTFSNHVVCSLLCALAGDMSESTKLTSKKYKDDKKNSQGFSNDNEANSTNLQPVVLTNVPKVLSKKLKKISKILLKEDMKEFLGMELSAIIVQALLFALKKQWPNCLKQFILRFSSTIFEETNDDGVPVAFLDRVCSFTVEAVFKSSDEELQQVLWETYFSKCLEQLIKDNIGNLLLQKLFDTVESKAQFEVMSNETLQHSKQILESHRYGIFTAIAAACNKHSAHQAQFTQSILQCLDCEEPERQKEVVPLILSFKPFGTSDAEIKVCHKGSVLLQSMLKFHKPKRMVQSILNLKPEEISNLAMDTNGCYVFHAYFGSVSVGEKNKDKLVELMKSCLSAIVSDRDGSLTLSRIWVLLSIKNRHAIIESLIQEESKLMNNRDASVAMKKFGAFFFKNDYEKWKIIQKNLH